MMKKYFFLVILTLFLSSGVNAEPKLLYHQNNEAKAVKGSVSNLIQAIRSGKQIRIYMNLGFVEHSMDAGFISIIDDNVYAQIDAIQSQRPNKSDGTITLRPYSKHVGFYSTLSPYEIKWFALN